MFPNFLNYIYKSYKKSYTKYVFPIWFLLSHKVEKCNFCGASIVEQVQHEEEVKDLEVGHVGKMPIILTVEL